VRTEWLLSGRNVGLWKGDIEGAKQTLANHKLPNQSTTHAIPKRVPTLGHFPKETDFYWAKQMVLLERIELSTSSLPRQGMDFQKVRNIKGYST
jgi:hypothetical protein